jgi:predicted NBD/HSP70 family sugar kinase
MLCNGHTTHELEGVLTSSSIAGAWLDVSSRSRADVIPLSKPIDAQMVLNLAQAGDLLARKIVQYRAEIVSDILVNLSLILNPGLILLGGEVGSHPVMLGELRKRLENSEFAVPKTAAAILGDLAVLWGAIASAIDEIPSVILPRPRN